MKLEKIQQEVLKALVKDPESVKYSLFGEDQERVFVTITATVGWIIPHEQLWLRLNKSKACHDFTDYEELVKQDNRLTATDEYCRGGSTRKYLSKYGEAVWIDSTLLKNFDQPELYQEAYKPKGPVLVTESALGFDARNVVGIVCPVNLPKQPEEGEL